MALLQGTHFGNSGFPKHLLGAIPLSSIKKTISYLAPKESLVRGQNSPGGYSRHLQVF